MGHLELRGLDYSMVVLVPISICPYPDPSAGQVLGHVTVLAARILSQITNKCQVSLLALFTLTLRNICNFWFCQGTVPLPSWHLGPDGQAVRYGDLACRCSEATWRVGAIR